MKDTFIYIPDNWVVCKSLFIHVQIGRNIIKIEIEK